jgi:hypothetical protein
MAEKVGYELTVPLPAHLISKQAVNFTGVGHPMVEIFGFSDPSPPGPGQAAISLPTP